MLWLQPQAVRVVPSLGSKHALARSLGQHTLGSHKDQAGPRSAWLLEPPAGPGGCRPASDRLCGERRCRFHFLFSLQVAAHAQDGPWAWAWAWTWTWTWQPNSRGGSEVRPSQAACLAILPPDPPCGLPIHQDGGSSVRAETWNRTWNGARVSFSGAGAQPRLSCDPGLSRAWVTAHLVSSGSFLG